ncbi:hypothetical protein llap_18230 [Limosa lapponica baueri]|uniref:Uncharacterized protein n=1 Tax=Limosa lapponica baueri TaxID=1758121 RepID=A0A2I0TCF8_LIMLA|nr:hypothetical protein llap_18230 [Limosa lapponica baueri]
MPAGSKTDPPLAKAEPISNGGSVSVATYLRRGKKCCTTEAGRVRKCERNNSADTKVNEEGGGGGVSGTGAEIPLQPVVKTVVTQVVPLQPVEETIGSGKLLCGVTHNKLLKPLKEKDIAAQVENMALKVCHVDAHMPKSRATEEHGNNEQVDKAVKIEVAQVDLGWEHEVELFVTR